MQLQGDFVLVFLLLLPILVYTIFSGRLGEFKAAGLEAKFVTVAEQSIEVVSETIKPSEEDMQLIAKGGVRELQHCTRNIDESKPIILTLIYKTDGYYDYFSLSRYLEALSQYRNFKLVVIIDHESKFVAYIPSQAMLQILRMDALGHEFVDIINHGDTRNFRQYPGVVTNTISTKTTNIETLQEMTNQNLDALVVVDENKKLKGVVERDQLMSKLLLGLAK